MFQILSIFILTEASTIPIIILVLVMWMFHQVIAFELEIGMVLMPTFMEPLMRLELIWVTFPYFLAGFVPVIIIKIVLLHFIVLVLKKNIGMLEMMINLDQNGVHKIQKVLTPSLMEIHSQIP